MIKKIDLPSEEALITRISTNNTIANAMKDAATITKAKADLALAAGVPLIIQMVQDSIAFDGVVKKDILDENNNVVDTLYFYKLIKPYKEITKVQISLEELTARIEALNAQKAELISQQNKAIAEEQAKADGIATAIPDTNGD